MLTLIVFGLVRLNLIHVSHLCMFCQMRVKEEFIKCERIDT